MAESDSVRLAIRFLTETGKGFNVSVRDADPELATSGQEQVKALVQYIMTNQPFVVKMASFDKAELVVSSTTEIEVSLDPVFARTRTGYYTMPPYDPRFYRPAGN